MKFAKITLRGKRNWLVGILVSLMIVSQLQSLRENLRFNLDSLCVVEWVLLNLAGDDGCLIRLPHYLHDADLAPKAVRLASLVALASRQDDITLQILQLELIPQRMDSLSASRVLLLGWLDGIYSDLSVWRGTASSQIIADTAHWLGMSRASYEIVEAAELAYQLDDAWRNSWQRGLNARAVGKQYSERGQLEQARSAYERAAASFIRAKELLALEYACYAYSHLGAIAEQQGDLAGAVEYYEQAILVSPQHAAFLPVVDIMLRQGHSLDDAYALLAELRQKGVQHDPYLWSNSALVFIERGALQMAEQVLVEVPLELENTSSIRYAKARLAAAQGKWLIAELLYTALLTEEQNEDKPDFQKLASLYNALGEVMLQQVKYTEAVAWFSEAIQLAPTVPKYLYNLGLAYQQSGRIDEARAAFEEALALQPDYVLAQRALHDLKP